MDEENSKIDGKDMPNTSGTANGVSLNKNEQGEAETLKNQNQFDQSENDDEVIITEPVFIPAAVSLDKTSETEGLDQGLDPSFDQTSDQAFDQTQEPTPAPKKSNRNLIIGVGVLVFVAIIGIVAGPKIMGNPFEKVMLAVAKTAGQGVENQSPMEQATGMAAAFENIYEGKTSMNASLSLVEAPKSVDPEGALTGAGIFYQMDTDIPSKLFYLDLGVMFDTAKLADFELYGKEDTIDFAVPVLVDGYFRVPLTNIGKAYKDSIFYQYQPMEIADDYSFNLFDEIASDGMGETETALGLKHADFWTRLQKDITTEKTDLMDVAVGEEMLPAQGYKIAMSDEKASLFFNDYADFWLTDVDAKAFLHEIITASAASNGIDPQEAISIIEGVILDAKTVLVSDLSLDIYIDDKDIVRKFILSGVFTKDGEAVTIKLDASLAGAGRATDDMNLAMTIGIDEELLSIEFQNKQYQLADEVITEGTLLMADKFVDYLDANWNGSYNAKDSSYSIDIDGRVDDERLQLSSKGMLEIPTKGKSFHLLMDTLDMSDTLNSKTETIRLKGEFNLDELSEPVKQATGTEYLLFEMDEAGLQAIVFEAYGNIMRLGEEFSGILE